MSPRDEHEPILNMPAALAFALMGGGRTQPAKIEPSAEHREAARQLHSVYTAFVDQGFTPDQAIELVKGMISRGQAQ